MSFVLFVITFLLGLTLRAIITNYQAHIMELQERNAWLYDRNSELEQRIKALENR